MRIPRVFLDQPLVVGQDAPLSKEARQHLERVLRLRPGHPVLAFNGQGGQCHAELMEGGRLRIHAHDPLERESPLPVRLIQGLSKGERMDLTLQKATELGVARISPVTTERSVVRLDEERAERRMQRWLGIVQSACEQCGRNRLPRVDEPQRLETVLGEKASQSTRIVLAPEGAVSLTELERPSRLEVLIGPEGGLSAREIELARQSGWIAVRLGPRILRTETAGLTLLAAVQTLWGDLG